MGLSGPTAALQRLANGLRNMDKTIAALPRQLANKSAELTRLSSGAQRTPEGAPWKRGPATSSPVGRKSGAMLGSIRAASSGLTFSVRVGRRYAWYFQHGAIHRDAIVGSAGKLRTRMRGAGRGKSGPRQKLVFSGPIRRGRERGIQASRGIVPSGDVPAAWAPSLRAIADSRIRADLGL